MEQQTSKPLGHLKITLGDMDAMVRCVENIIEARQNSYSVALNLTKYVVSKNDSKLADSINDAHQVIADGVPIVWLSKRAGYANVHRVTGVDLSEKLLGLAKTKGWRLYFVGASPTNLELALSNIAKRFDSPDIAGSRNGYFQDKDIPTIIADINASRPDILFLGLGMPQKEYFLRDHFSKLDVPYCITVGGAIDVWAGAKSRTPRIIQAVGLEWFARSFYDYSKAYNIMRYGLYFLRDLAFYRSVAKN